MNLTRISNVLARVSKTFAALACGLLAVLVTVVVFQRFVTNNTPSWAEELPRLILVWATFIGGVVCSRDRTHLMAGLLPYIVKNQRVLEVMDRINHVLIVVGLTVLGWAGWQLAQMTMEQMLPAIDVSAGVVYLALPVACGLTVIVHIAQLFEPWPPKQVDLPIQI